MSTAELGIVVTIAIFILGILLAIIAWFLKRTIGIVDDCQKQQIKMKEEKANVSDLNALREEMKDRFEKVTDDIAGIKEDYITKDDFFREQAKTDRKLDMILDILLKWKGCKNDNE